MSKQPIGVYKKMQRHETTNQRQIHNIGNVVVDGAPGSLLPDAATAGAAGLGTVTPPENEGGIVSKNLPPVTEGKVIPPTDVLGAANDAYQAIGAAGRDGMRQSVMNAVEVEKPLMNAAIHTMP